MTDIRPRVLSILPVLNPSGMLFAVKPLRALHARGAISAQVKLEHQVRQAHLDVADIVLFGRNADPSATPILDYLDVKAIPYIYELDDNFFDVPAAVDRWGIYRAPATIAMFQRYLGGARLVRVHSPPLAERAKEFCQNLEIVSGSVDFQLVQPRRPARTGDPIRIVYATARYKDMSGSLLLPALTALLDKYGGRIEIHLYGYCPEQLRGDQRVKFHAPIPDYERYLRRFSAASYDIGLAPLPDDSFHRAKTNNKFREYGACGVAGVYSNFEVYSASVRDGESGLLVQNHPDEWKQAIVRLIEDAPLRAKVAEQAEHEVRRDYDQTRFENLLLTHLLETLRNAGEARGPATIHSTVPPPSPEGLMRTSEPGTAEQSVRGKLARGLTLLKRARQGGLRHTIHALTYKLQSRWLLWKIQHRYGFQKN